MTPKEQEVLDILQEECAEVVSACSKIKRFGFDNYNPADPNKVPKWKHLEQEIGDVIAMLQFVVDLNVGITVEGIEVAYKKKLEKLKKFSRYLYNDTSESSSSREPDGSTSDC